MSVDAVLARVNELQQMIAGAQPAPAASSAFAAQLASATATTMAPAAGVATAPGYMPSTGASDLPSDTPFGAEITAACSSPSRSTARSVPNSGTPRM